MADLTKLKIAIGQPELFGAAPSRNLDARERMVGKAVEAGADLLVLPGSLSDASDVHLIALNDSRIDIAGSVVLLEAAGESYQIGLGDKPQGCDFAVYSDIEPWSLMAPSRPSWPGIVLRPVGMHNVGRKVLAYDGGTSVFSDQGQLLARLRDDFEEDFACISLSEKGKVAKPCKDKLLAALVKTIRRFDEQVIPVQSSWVVGLSGGLDSSIVAALLTFALGADRVVGFNLTTEFSSKETQANAKAVAKALGFDMHAGSVGDLVGATELVCQQFGLDGTGDAILTGKVVENVQARVRGHALCTLAALEEGVVANCSNRVEQAFGYMTLYGDSIGALCPIGDLVKTRLFELAHVINGTPNSGIIPKNLLPRETADGYDWKLMPSAELALNQRDPMKWFYYDWLIEEILGAPSIDAGACGVLSHYLDDRLRSSSVAKWLRFYKLTEPADFLADFDEVMHMLRAATFKRAQTPPSITIASPASILSAPEIQGEVEFSKRYQELRARIQRM